MDKRGRETFWVNIQHTWAPSESCLSLQYSAPPTLPMLESTSRFLGKVVYYDNSKSLNY